MDKTLVEIKRGEEADYLINHTLMREAFEKVHSGIINAMTDAPMGDEKTHNRLVIALQLLEQIKARLHEVVATGKMAKMQAETPVGQRIKKAVGW